ncbi:alpha/beta fold hydrolase [Nonomuraea sp. C10]|uniref:thioesterase domain-containing protein n=1 Tax=Nonomuraea sp. C10 TaxID=2600577 RepID=UPI0011CE3D34|nr:alpha/beta fold hydrolase [Nonomuraea sp. C10]TXK39865.1 alpha/beta fold hydrolase [Nonomuraea sp. C10]
MAGSHPSALAEKRRALLDLRLRRRREEALAQQEAAPPEGRPRPSGRTVSPLVPLGPAGTEPPLFLVHAAGGSVAPYVALAGLLGDDRQVCALEDPGLHGGAIGERSLADLAATYLAAVREARPDGPLHVGGWSVGGAVALEMARHDGDVALTFVLDTAVPDAPSRPGDDELSAWFASDVAAMGAEPGEAELAERFPVFAANVRALLTFRPSRVDSRVVLLCAEKSEGEKLSRWRPYADEIQVVPGDHYTMLRPPHIEALAEAMRHRLSEVSVR